jgi:CDP-diacylglycerol--glycerol-3-phosphate 3-phosphatidyltransferase
MQSLVNRAGPIGPIRWASSCQTAGQSLLSTDPGYSPGVGPPFLLLACEDFESFDHAQEKPMFLHRTVVQVQKDMASGVQPRAGVEPWWTTPNVVTVLRTVGSAAAGVWAISSQSVVLLVVAYVIYWVGDMLDGYLARRLGQETTPGAVLDIVCDRVCSAICGCCILVLAPETWPAILAVLLSFVMVDTMLSLSFLYWDLKSPNYFGNVDKTVWRLNWSPPAKALNTAGLVFALGFHQLAAGAALVTLVLFMKLWSLGRVRHLLVAGAWVAPGAPVGREQAV